MAERGEAKLSSGPVTGVPYASSVVALSAEQFAVVRRAVALLHRTAHMPAYQKRVDSGAEPAVLHDPGNCGVLMGYDFHLTEAGPRLIEINTNAGGALLNGLHSASLCDPERLGGVCSELLPMEEIQERIVASFRQEFTSARGEAAVLQSVAIADENPQQQLLFSEFEMFRDLFSEFGIRASICDTAELVAGPHGDLELRGDPVDLVYLRDTDFTLASDRVRDLRRAYLSRRAVVTPSPREHHLLGNKGRLEIFSSRPTLESLGLAAEDAAFLGEVVPETRRLAELGFDEAWQGRRQWVFKPAAAFGGRAVYRGDKISRRRFDQICAEGGFLAQRRIEPGRVQVETSEGPANMKFDVRAYAYRDRVLLLGARIYQGQVTNFRSPGGGFSAICVARDGESSTGCRAGC
jgi:hypothetical protein